MTRYLKPASLALAVSFFSLPSAAASSQTSLIGRGCATSLTAHRNGILMASSAVAAIGASALAFGLGGYLPKMSTPVKQNLLHTAVSLGSAAAAAAASFLGWKIAFMIQDRKVQPNPCPVLAASNSNISKPKRQRNDAFLDQIKEGILLKKTTRKEAELAEAKRHAHPYQDALIAELEKRRAAINSTSASSSSSAPVEPPENGAP